MTVIDKLKVFAKRHRQSNSGAGRLSFILGRISLWAGSLFHEIQAGGLNLRAMGLVYTTLLSLVPLIAVSFSVLKAFGAHNQVEPLLLELLYPLGEKGQEITENIIGFVDNLKVGVLGSLGLALLFYTVISLLQKVEESFNYIWRTNRLRSILRRFSDYLSVIMVGPVLVFSALGITASWANIEVIKKVIAIEPLGTAFYSAGLILPYVLLIAAFTFMYKFIPNTPVRFGSALAGGTVAGVLWKTAGWGFAVFVADSTNYDAIYSGFAILIIFMIWLNLSWLILLLGVQVSFYYQNPHYLGLKQRQPRLSNRLKERVGLVLMYLIADSHYRGADPWSLQALAQRLNLPENIINNVIRVLEAEGFVVAIDAEQPTYVPARDNETIAITDLLVALRRSNEQELTIDPDVASVPAVDCLLAEIDSTIRLTIDQRSLRDMLVWKVENGEAKPVSRLSP